MPKKATQMQIIREEVHSRKREEILKCAEHLFAVQGYKGTSMVQIADALGATKPFIYYHFDSKEELLKEIYQRILFQCIDTISKARAVGGSPAEQLFNFAYAFTLLVIEKSQSVAIFLREENSLPDADLKEVNRIRQQFDDALKRLLKEGIGAGEFTIEDVELTALAIGGMAGWVYTWYRKGGRLSPAQIAKQMANLTLRLAKAGH